MDEQQAIASLVTQNKATEAAQQALLLKDKPAPFFLAIFDGINGLQRIELFKAILAAHSLVPPDDSGLMLKFYQCLRPSEHGVVLEEMDNEQIVIMLKLMEEHKKVEMFELLPYTVVEKLVPIMTVFTSSLFSLPIPRPPLHASSSTFSPFHHPSPLTPHPSLTPHTSLMLGCRIVKNINLVWMIPILVKERSVCANSIVKYVL